MKKNVFFVMLLAGILCLSGCGTEEQERKELNIFEEDSAMKEWKDTLPVSEGAVQSGAVRGLSVENDGEEVFTVAYSPREYKSSFAWWEITAPYPAQTTVNTETLYALLEQLDGLELVEDDSGKTVQETGISDSESYITIVQSSDEQDAEAASVLRFRIGSSDGNGHVYAAAEGSDAVGLLPETTVNELLSVDPYNYILKIPVLPDISTVSDVEVEKSGELYTMSLKDGEYVMNSHEVDEEEYNTAYQTLLGILITGELPEGEKTDTEEEPLLTVRFFRNTDEASDIEVVYYPYDDSHAAISINDTEFFLADLEEVENVCGQFF